MVSHLHLAAAACYLPVGVALGMYMGITQDSRLLAVHVHVLALGWISLSIIALIYEALPHIQTGWIPRVHLLLHNLGLLILLGAMAGAPLTPEQAVLPLLAGSSMLLCGTVLFCLQMISGLVHKW